jgi:hypothetical protein
LPDHLTLIPDEFLAELERLHASGRLALSPTFRDFLARAASQRTVQDTIRKASSDAPSGTSVKSPLIHTVAEGASSWTSVDLLDVDMWGVTIRSSLEGFGIKVNRFPVGRGQHIVNVLSGEEATAPYVLLSLHGERDKLLLPPLAEEVAATERFNDALTPEDLHTFVNLPGRVVISLGCETGTLNLARAFLDHGCTAYIGPEGQPYGHASLFVPIFLFYELTEGRTLEEAVERLRRHDQELAMWRLFQ